MTTLKEALAHGSALHEAGQYRVITEGGKVVVENQHFDPNSSPIEVTWLECETADEVAAIPESGWTLTDEYRPGAVESKY